VVSCDNITTVPRAAIGRLLGYLHPDREPDLAHAIAAAYDLDL
jgi:mRNA interferase MazF